MTKFALNLPIDIPWKLIAVSPDMMDTTFCNKRFPFAWRSSLAISAYEPKLEDLPEEMCEERMAFLKVTCTVTGYQPSKEEVEQGYAAFPNVPTEDLARILSEYFACYGMLLNVAVFPQGTTKKRRERQRVAFGAQQPGQTLPNPYQSAPFTFQATVPSNRPNNRVVDLYPRGGDGQGELDLVRQMDITFPATSRVEARVVHAAQPVAMEAYRGTLRVGVQTTGPEQNLVHDLAIDAEGIDRVVLKAPQNEASLLEFAIYTEIEEPIQLPDYPHIVDFEPKARDLYQAASEFGEVLTGSFSGVNTGKSFTHTENTQTSLGVGAKTSASVPIPNTPLTIGSEISGSISHTWGETDQEGWSVQTDASRDRRERQATTTSISQMYNLLTGYHPGTNRAAFIMLPRPHTLQPTDHRTFAHGLRMIEGVQEFFLIVARPRGVDGLAVEAFLETGHFPEKVEVEEPPVEYDESQEEFTVSAYAKGGTGVDGAWNAECTDIQHSYAIGSGWVIDRRPGKGDPGHPGVMEIGNNSNNQANTSLRNYNYQPTSDSNVSVTGRICGANYWGPGAIFERTYRVLTRSEQPKPPSTPPVVKTPFLITSRGLCASYRSDEPCLQLVPVARARGLFETDQIVDERTIDLDPAVIALAESNQTRTPVLKDLLTQIHFALASSARRPTRRPFGEGSFLETDYFKDQIKRLLPPERLEIPLSRVPDLPRSLVRRLGGRRTVAEVLDLDLARFAETAGVGIEEGLAARRRLLGLPERPNGEREPDGAA
ncbi:MAG: hypothetical protein M3Q65_16160 [Chloroflexota bacterium]|nr:hypothetical protein [Chloroflexota bacterium]